MGPGWRGRGPRGNKPEDETDESIAKLSVKKHFPIVNANHEIRGLTTVAQKE